MEELTFRMMINCITNYYKLFELHASHEVSLITKCSWCIYFISRSLHSCQFTQLLHQIRIFFTTYIRVILLSQVMSLVFWYHMAERKVLNISSLVRLQVYKTVFFKTIHLENYYNGLHFSFGLIRFMIGLDCNQWEMTNFNFGNFEFWTYRKIFKRHAKKWC